MKKFLKFLLPIPVFAITLPIALLPYRTALKAGELCGSLLLFFWRSRGRIAQENIIRCQTAGSIDRSLDPAQTIRKNFRNLGRSFAEIIKIYCGLGDHIVQAVEIRGIDHFQTALARGKGVLFITGHCGNWELLALAFGRSVREIYIVARGLDVPLLNRLLERTRQRYGNRVIYKQGALKRIFSVLRSNGTVGILMDQGVVSSEGMVIDFLGRSAWTMKMPSMIARKTGAAVLPAFIHREGDRHVVEIGKEIKLDVSATGEDAIRNDTINFSHQIEDFIKRHPAEWLWIHRRWKRTGE